VKYKCVKIIRCASVRPFLNFGHFHIFELFCTSTALLRPLYFDLLTSSSVLRPFVKSGFVIGREVQLCRSKVLVEVKFVHFSVLRPTDFTSTFLTKIYFDLYVSTNKKSRFDKMSNYRGRSTRVKVKRSK